MGVTIHFSGKLTNDAALAGVEQVAREFANIHGWSVRTIDHAVNAAGDYTGVSLHVSDTCEPIHLVFNEDLVLNDFVKTQFAGSAVHIEITKLLREIQPWFARLDVADEGEFWDTGDRPKLETHMAIVAARLDELSKKRPGSQVALRLPSGRIVDLRNDPRVPSETSTPPRSLLRRMLTWFRK